jgi:predicted RNA methylase
MKYTADNLHQSEGAIAIRKTIGEICGYRDKALATFNQAFDVMEEANNKIADAISLCQKAAPTRANNYSFFDSAAREHFLTKLKLPEKELYMTKARKHVDIEVWAHVIELSGLEKLMDKKAKEELRSSLRQDPPEATEENIKATVEGFMVDADMIFKRGLAECFCKLDRRFRSHDGWKIGSRIILNRAFNEYGGWNYYANHGDTIIDIERVFCTLEERSPLSCGAVHLINEARRGQRSYSARQTELETEYFTVRIFKNGNAHLWFNKRDLLEKVNKILGEYYGAPIPEERSYTSTEQSDLYNPKTTLAKNYGFYPTPEPAAERLIQYVSLYRYKEGNPLTVLEPSAGTGNLAYRAVEKGAIVDCIEIQPLFADNLEKSGKFRSVIQADFLMIQPEAKYDHVLMNPPFDRERDIDHVLHALKFLKPGGELIAIMSAGTEFRETKKSIAFRNMVESMKGKWCDLPERSFSSVGTNCNTVMLKIAVK